LTRFRRKDLKRGKRRAGGEEELTAQLKGGRILSRVGRQCVERSSGEKGLHLSCDGVRGDRVQWRRKGGGIATMWGLKGGKWCNQTPGAIRIKKRLVKEENWKWAAGSINQVRATKQGTQEKMAEQGG